MQKPEEKPRLHESHKGRTRRSDWLAPILVVDFPPVLLWKSVEAVIGIVSAAILVLDEHQVAERV